MDYEAFKIVGPPEITRRIKGCRVNESCIIQSDHPGKTVGEIRFIPVNKLDVGPCAITDSDRDKNLYRLELYRYMGDKPVLFGKCYVADPLMAPDCETYLKNLFMAERAQRIASSLEPTEMVIVSRIKDITRVSSYNLETRRMHHIDIFRDNPLMYNLHYKLPLCALVYPPDDIRIYKNGIGTYLAGEYIEVKSIDTSFSTAEPVGQGVAYFEELCRREGIDPVEQCKSDYEAYFKDNPRVRSMDLEDLGESKSVEDIRQNFYHGLSTSDDEFMKALKYAFDKGWNLAIIENKESNERHVMTISKDGESCDLSNISLRQVEQLCKIIPSMGYVISDGQKPALNSVYLMTGSDIHLLAEVKMARANAPWELALNAGLIADMVGVIGMDEDIMEEAKALFKSLPVKMIYDIDPAVPIEIKFGRSKVSVDIKSSEPMVMGEYSLEDEQIVEDTASKDNWQVRH